jgi:hypothetical protein
MPYFHHDVQLAEAKIKENLPFAFIERSDKGFGLSIYTPPIGHTIVFQRNPEIRANVDEVIAKYRPKAPEQANAEG